MLNRICALLAIGTFAFAGSLLNSVTADLPSLTAGDLYPDANVVAPSHESPVVWSASERTLMAAADTFVGSGFADRNFNGYVDHGWNAVVIGNYAGAGENRAYLKFDLSGLPGGISVTSAKLWLRMVVLYHFGPTRIDIFRAQADWNVDSLSWTNKPPDGNLVASSDVGPTLGWHTWDVTSLVHDWTQGSTENYGLMLRGPESGGTDVKSFASQEQPSYEPRLQVEFLINTPTVTLTPTSSPTSTATHSPTFTFTTTSTQTVTATPVPVSIFVPNLTGGELRSNDAGESTRILIPAGALGTDGTVTYSHRAPTDAGAMVNIGYGFELSARGPDDNPLARTASAIVIEIQYAGFGIDTVFEEDLTLFRREANGWTTDEITTTLSISSGSLTAATRRFGWFAVLAEGGRLYFPLAVRSISSSW